MTSPSCYLKCLEYVVHAANGVCALIKEGLFVGIEAEVEDLFPAIAADDHGYAQTDVLLSVFAVEGNAAGE